MTKPKYKQGKQILTISEFDTDKSMFYKWNGKTVHASVLMSLQYRTLKSIIECGRLYKAELIEPYEIF